MKKRKPKERSQRIPKKMLLTTFLQIALIVTIALCSSCLDFLDNREPKDWSESVKVYVASETGVYFSSWWGLDNPAEGMKIKEEKMDYWYTVHFETIEDFTYERGYEYILKVKKTHLANPPADGSSVRYRLIEILSKELK